MTNFDIDRLLAEGSDDTGEPLRRSLDDVVRRGRRRVRRRRLGGAAAGTLAVGALVSGAMLWPASGDDGGGFDAPPVAGKTSTTPKAPRLQMPPPVATMPDRQIIQRCQVLDAEFRRNSENKAGGGTDPIDDWTVLIKQAPQRWIQAVLVSPDSRRFGYCVFDTRGTYRQEYIREAFQTPDHEVFTGGIDGAVDRVPDNVARLTFETADGVITEARIKNHVILWFNGRPYSEKPIWATFYDASGTQLAKFNANPKPATPTMK